MRFDEALRYIGLNRIEAKACTYLFKQPEGYIIDIEQHTKLRQPEVSNALRKLEQRGWVELEHINDGSIGRPKNYYYFDRDTARKDIIKLFKQEMYKLGKAYKLVEGRIK